MYSGCPQFNHPHLLCPFMSLTEEYSIRTGAHGCDLSGFLSNQSYGHFHLILTPELLQDGGYDMPAIHLAIQKSNCLKVIHAVKIVVMCEQTGQLHWVTQQHSAQSQCEMTTHRLRMRNR
jgi:hypothetical protein